MGGWKLMTQVKLFWICPFLIFSYEKGKKTKKQKPTSGSFFFHNYRDFFMGKQSTAQIWPLKCHRRFILGSPLEWPFGGKGETDKSTEFSWILIDLSWHQLCFFHYCNPPNALRMRQVTRSINQSSESVWLRVLSRNSSDSYTTCLTC